MSTNPNTVKSQHELTNEGGRKSDVLVEAISKLETTTKQLEMAVKYLKKLTHKEDWRLAREALKQIEELNK